VALVGKGRRSFASGIAGSQGIRVPYSSDEEFFLLQNSVMPTNLTILLHFSLSCAVTISSV